MQGKEHVRHKNSEDAVIHIDAPLLHHFFYTTVAQRSGQVPSDALQYQPLFETPAVKEYSRHGGYLSN